MRLENAYGWTTDAVVYADNSHTSIYTETPPFPRAFFRFYLNLLLGTLVPGQLLVDPCPERSADEGTRYEHHDGVEYGSERL